jgi:hypothetical protein
MKLTVFIAIFFSLNVNAQIKYFLEYNSSCVFPSENIVLENTLLLCVQKYKSLFYLGLGREDWYLEYFDNIYFTNPSIYNAHCRTYKISTSIEHEFLISTSKLSINTGLGVKMYFLNQLKDSLSSIYGDLNTTRPSYLQDAKDKNIDLLNGIDLDNFAFITSVPYSFTANIALQYTFKKWGLKLYYQPYFMKIKYETVKSSKRGSNFIFYNNIGLGINYPLNFKKKDQKVTEIE